MLLSEPFFININTTHLITQNNTINKMVFDQITETVSIGNYLHVHTIRMDAELFIL